MVLPNASVKLDGSYLIAENITAMVTVTVKLSTDKPFATVIMDGLAISVKKKLMISPTNAKMASITMVTVTVTQIIMAHGVKSIDHREPVHATVAMETVIWEKLLRAITVYAIQVSPAQTAIPSYALVDVLVNSVALSIIKQNVMIILQLHAFKNHVQAINITLWLVPLRHVSATLATLAFHLAILQIHAQPCPVESISIAL